MDLLAARLSAPLACPEQKTPRKGGWRHWQDVRASPLRALSLTGLAPAVVLTVGHDPLRDEGIDYAQRLEAEGVRVRHLHASDLVHGALTMCAAVRPGVGLIRYVGQALADALG